jgi:hypothetical protein
MSISFLYKSVFHSTWAGETIWHISIFLGLNLELTPLRLLLQLPLAGGMAERASRHGFCRFPQSQKPIGVTLPTLDVFGGIPVYCQKHSVGIECGGGFH